jgi:molybdopterin/thiamine biosynthesis adenylyltransferase
MNDNINRNVKVWGEKNQELLSKLNVCVIGSDILSQMVLAGIAGLNVGKINIIDNSRIYNNQKNFLVENNSNYIGKEKVKVISNTIKLINKNIEINPIFGKFNEAFCYNLKPDIIIDATNDEDSKIKSSYFAFNYKIPFLSLSSDISRYSICSYYPKTRLKSNFLKGLENIIDKCIDGKEQGLSSSGIVAGITCEEIRKLSFRYDSEDIILDSLDSLLYNISDNDRNNFLKKSIYPSFKDLNALIVGSGAIGNIVGLNCALHGLKEIDIIDFDRIEAHNLNRQILLYDKIGEYKSKVLAERIKNISPNTKVSYIIGKVGSFSDKEDLEYLKELYNCEKNVWNNRNKNQKFIDYDEFEKKYFGNNNREVTLVSPENIKNKKYDIIFGCLDNKYPRIWLSRIAEKYSIPLVDGGTNPYNGQIYYYYPGFTNSIENQANLLTWSYPKDIVSCIDHSEGSVVMSNMIVGSLLVHEGLYFLKRDKKEINPLIKYNCKTKSKITFVKD